MNVVEHISGYGDVTVTMVGDQAQLGGSAAATMQMTVEGKTIDERMTPAGTYVDAGTQLPGGAIWMEITAAGLSKVLGVKDASSLFSSQGDPSQLLGLLGASSPTGVTDLGTTTIQGIGTTEYEATIDLSTIAQHESADYAQLLQQYRKFLTSQTVPMKVWIDGSGLPRQITTELSEHLLYQGIPLSADVVLTLDLSNYGEHVSVEPPPASQVYVVPNSQLKSIASLAGGSN